MTDYIRGDTIRLKATFTNWAGTPTDPDGSSISLKIYDSAERVILTVAHGSITKDGTGVYHYDYTTTADGKYTFEYSATVGGETELARKEFFVTFS